MEPPPDAANGPDVLCTQRTIPYSIRLVRGLYTNMHNNNNNNNNNYNGDEHEGVRVAPKTRQQENKEKRMRRERREAAKYNPEEEEASSSSEEVNPMDRAGFCSFFSRHSAQFCPCANELRGYCLEHFKLRVANVLKQQGKTHEYVNAKRLLQRTRQALVRKERAKRQEYAQDMEVLAMAANQVRPEDFAFTEDVPPPDEDVEAPRGPPVLLLPHVPEHEGPQAMDEDDKGKEEEEEKGEEDVEEDDEEDEWLQVE